MSNRTQCATLHVSYLLIISQTFFFQFISNNFELENVVKMTPKRRSFLPALFFTCFCITRPLLIYVVVQFYPWFKFSFLLFLGMVMYDNNMIMSLKQKKRKFEPKIKIEPQHIFYFSTYSVIIPYYYFFLFQILFK